MCLVVHLRWNLSYIASVWCVSVLVQGPAEATVMKNYSKSWITTVLEALNQ